jgi:acyl-CoA thioesterase
MDKHKLKEFFKDDRYAALTGIEIIEIEEGYAKCKLEIEDKHLNAANVVQGGALFTLADFCMGIASNSRGQLALAINANIIFLKGKSKGTLYATACEVADPKRIGAYNVQVTDETDEIIASFSGVVYRKNEKLGI